MFPLAHSLFPAIASVITFALWKYLQLLRCYVSDSPLNRLRGPKGTNFIFGHWNEIINYNGELLESWHKTYGDTLALKALFNGNQLFTADTRTISHILTHSQHYQKPQVLRKGIAEVFGEGLLAVEGNRHRMQRRIMNPAFGPAQVREFTETFFMKASQLRHLWSSEIATASAAAIAGKCIDVVPWLNKMTLDIIGLTGFNYNFNALDSSGDLSELGKVFSILFAASQNVTLVNIVLRALIPFLCFIPSAETRKLRAAQRTMIQIGKELLASAKETVRNSEMGKGEAEKNSSGLHGRDLLSLLVKANVADIPEKQRLSDDDVIAQVHTFFVAGHETTSNAIAWALYALTQAPEVQTKLRNELLSVDAHTPTMDQLMALPFLDAVVRETLRLHAPVPFASRTAIKDDVLPVEKPYVDKYGVVCDTIGIAKGDHIVISILEVNRSKDIWGLDAHDFKPERWNNVPEAVRHVPGVWGHLLTFIGGPRACIGYRFALVEIKAILFELVRAFEFELAVPPSDISSKLLFFQRPVLRSDPIQRPQLPLLIKPYQS